MPKFELSYTFNGYGTVVIEAENKEEAEDKFSEGEFSNEEERTEDFEVNHVMPAQMCTFFKCKKLKWHLIDKKLCKDHFQKIK